MKYFKNTSWLFGEKILKMIVGLFVGIWVARYLGPEQFGLLSYAGAFVGLFAVIATLGLDKIIVRELVKDDTKRDILLGTAFRLKIIGAFIVFLLLTIVVQFTNNDCFTNILIFILASAIICQSFNVIVLYFQSKVLSKYVVYSNIIVFLSSSSIKIVLILSKAPLLSFVLVSLFDAIFLVINLIYIYSRQGLTFRNWVFDKALALTLLKESWPLIFVSIASLINMRVDQVMIANMIDIITVGNYAAAIRISEVWLVLPTVLGASLYPSFIAAKERNEYIYRKRLHLTAVFMATLTIPSAILITFFSEQIMYLLFGEQYATAGLYLSIHIWSGVPYLIFFAFNYMYYIEHLTKLVLYVTIFAVISNISLNIILIPIYGGVGAAFATLITAVCSSILSLSLLHLKTGIFRRRYEKK